MSRSNEAYLLWQTHILTCALEHTLRMLVELYASEALSEKGRSTVYALWEHDEQALACFRPADDRAA